MGNPYPQWFSDDELTRAYANYQQTQTDNDGSYHWPVIKLFTPDAQATWLITEVEPEHNELSFGLCDLGIGCPELGYVSLSELKELRGPYKLPIERDSHFIATSHIMAYASAAREHGRIVEISHA